MQHVHYDLDKVDRDTRAMYAEFKPRDYAEEFLKRNSEIQVLMTRAVLTGIMEGSDPDKLMKSISYVVAQLMLNITNHFGGASRENVMSILMEEIGNQIDATFSLPDGGIVGTIDVKTVKSGNA